MREFDILSKLKDEPNVLQVFEYHEARSFDKVKHESEKDVKNDSEKKHLERQLANKAVCISTELCENGSLFDFVACRQGIQDDLLLKYLFLQICRGIQSLHLKAQQAHLDIKLDNVLIGNDFRLRICDFGHILPLASQAIKDKFKEVKIKPSEIQNSLDD